MRNKGTPENDVANEIRRSKLEEEEQRSIETWQKEYRLQHYFWAKGRVAGVNSQTQQSEINRLTEEREQQNDELYIQKAHQLRSFYTYKKNELTAQYDDIVARNVILTEKIQRLKMKVKHCCIHRVHVKSKFVSTQNNPFQKLKSKVDH